MTKEAWLTMQPLTFYALLYAPAEFKPRMEKLLRDVILLSDVASIAMEADNLSQHPAGTPSKEEVSPDKQDSDMGPSRRRGLGEVSWTSVRFGEKEMENSAELEKPTPQASSSSPSPNDDPRGLQHTMSGNIQIKSLLDRWEEPLTKNDKVSRLQPIVSCLVQPSSPVREFSCRTPPFTMF